MDFSFDPELYYIPFIERIMPELHILKIKMFSEGLANDVVVVNDEMVFRFTKGEYGRSSLGRELPVLEKLQNQTDLRLPQPLYTSETAIVYRYLPGESFTRDRLTGLDPADGAAVSSQLAAFLKTMHAVQDLALPLTAAPVKAEAFQDQRRRVRERVYPLLLPHQVEWAEQVYIFIDQPGAFEFQPALIHGDLAPYHILFDPQARRLCGVIDFGVSGLGDPASDLGSLLQYYGVDFVRLVVEAYPELELCMPRARFYAQAIEIQWVLLGLEKGEPFWNTAHLGGWRGLD